MTTTTTTPNPFAIVVPLHVARIGHRRFTAAVSYKPSPNGWLVSDVTGTRKTAIASLEAKLRANGSSVPAWNVKDLGDLSARAPAPQSEVPAAPAAKPERLLSDLDGANLLESIDAVTAPEPTAESTIGHLNDPSAVARPVGQVPAVVGTWPNETTEADAIADRAEEALEAAKASMLPTLAPRMDGGYVTPLSDKAAWSEVYREARSKFDSVDVPGENRREKIKNYRESINVLMERVSFIGPWRSTQGGNFWIYFSDEPDHTVRGAVKRNPRAVQWTKNINGNWIKVERDRKDPEKLAVEPKPKVTRAEVLALIERAADEQDGDATTKSVTTDDTPTETPMTRAEKKAANRAAAAEARKARKAAEGPSYTGDKAAYGIAHRYARSVAGAAAAAGKSKHISNLMFKIGMVVSLRSQGAAPHVKYEASLAEEGITDEMLAAQTMQYGSEAKAA